MLLKTKEKADMGGSLCVNLSYVNKIPKIGIYKYT